MHGNEYTPLAPDEIMYTFERGLQVETENLRQKCEQAAQEEAKGRAMTEAKLEKCVTRRNREVTRHIFRSVASTKKERFVTEPPPA